MANPQPDMHTQISNEILEHLMMMPLSGNQWQVLMCIIRKTYGFHKKQDCLTNSQIIEATKLGKTVVSRCLTLLQEGNFIIRKGHIMGFQKDWEQWQPELAKRITKVSQTDNNKQEEKLATWQPELAKRITKVSHPLDIQKKKETIQKKDIYGEFKNVLLTTEEYEKLQQRFPDYLDRIERLSEYISSKGKKYASHYATILTWARKDTPVVEPKPLYKVVN